VLTRRSLLPIVSAALIATAIAAPAFAQDATPSGEPPAGPAITVVGGEYYFGGLPTTVPAGTILSLDNQGQELHELIVARKNDGVTQSWEELLQLSDEEAFQYVTIVGGMPLFAAPGALAEGTLVIPSEGEYIALCFIPQGTTEMPADDADPSMIPSGPPHFVLGMIQTFTVTAAGTEPGPVPSAMPMGEMPEGSPAP
jgi:hypothetical protein